MLSVSIASVSSASDKKENTRKKEVAVLPLITFYDVDRDATYNWWSEQETLSLDIKKHSQNLYKDLAKDNGKVIRFLDPFARNIKFRENLQKTVLKSEEMLAISKDLNAELVLVGDIIIEKSSVISEGTRMKVNVKILRAPAFNEVGSVYHVSDLYAADYLQLIEVGGNVWHEVRASIEKRIEDYRPSQGEKLELIVNGTFDHHQLQQFHRYLKGNITNIKSISPGFLDKDSFGIFVEYAGKGTESLSRELKETKIEGFMTQVVSSTNSQVIFDVRPLNAVK